MSKIQVVCVCVSVGRVDDFTSGANQLRVSGSLGRKVGDLAKMKDAFVVKYQGNKDSPANLPKRVMAPLWHQGTIASRAPKKNSIFWRGKNAPK